MRLVNWRLQLELTAPFVPPPKPYPGLIPYGLVRSHWSLCLWGSTSCPRPFFLPLSVNTIQFLNLPWVPNLLPLESVCLQESPVPSHLWMVPSHCYPNWNQAVCCQFCLPAQWVLRNDLLSSHAFGDGVGFLLIPMLLLNHCDTLLCSSFEGHTVKLNQPSSILTAITLQSSWAIPLTHPWLQLLAHWLRFQLFHSWIDFNIHKEEPSNALSTDFFLICSDLFRRCTSATRGNRLVFLITNNSTPSKISILRNSISTFYPSRSLILILQSLFRGFYNFFSITLLTTSFLFLPSLDSITMITLFANTLNSLVPFLHCICLAKHQP